MDENTTTTASANVPSTLSAKSAMRTPEPRRSIGGGGAAGGRSSKRMMHKDLNRLASMGGSPGSTTTTATAPGAAASRNPLSTPVRGAMPSGDVPTTPSASVVPADKVRAVWARVFLLYWVHRLWKVRYCGVSSPTTPACAPARLEGSLCPFFFFFFYYFIIIIILFLILFYIFHFFVINKFFFFRHFFIYIF